MIARTRDVIVLALGLLAAAFVAADGSDPKAATPGVSPSARLAPLAWIAGTWRADVGGDQLDEYWSPPAGDSMFGAFRWMKGEKAWMFEMLTIMDDGKDAILRIKHFDNKGVGWEEKAEAVTMRLVQSDAKSAHFERIESNEPFKITYRQERPDELLIILEHTHDGKSKKDEFRFRRLAN